MTPIGEIYVWLYQLWWKYHPYFAQSLCGSSLFSLSTEQASSIFDEKAGISLNEPRRCSIGRSSCRPGIGRLIQFSTAIGNIGAKGSQQIKELEYIFRQDWGRNQPKSIKTKLWWGRKPWLGRPNFSCRGRKHTELAWERPVLDTSPSHMMAILIWVCLKIGYIPNYIYSHFS